MQSLPKIVASSVVRSTHKGESHGGVYVVDLEAGTWTKPIDWNTVNISWEGRGFERGLRGIAFFDDRIYLAASNELFVYDAAFNEIGSFANRYLHQCHEICVGGTSLYLSSTGFDSVLEFDLVSREFVRGYCFREFGAVGDVFESDPVSRSLIRKPSVPPPDSAVTVGRLYRGLRRRVKQGIDGLLGGGTAVSTVPAPKVAEEVTEPTLVLRPFDPNSDGGPVPADTLHINNVYWDGARLYLSGTGVGWLYALEEGALGQYAAIPHGTHNVRPSEGGVLMHETAADRVAVRTRDGELIRSYDIVRYDESALLMSGLPKDFCRQAFGRGLAVSEDGLIVAGSSPATISVYRRDNPAPIASVNITMDVRNAIHGLEIWPY
jgi:hypothetical protein